MSTTELKPGDRFLNSRETKEIVGNPPNSSFYEWISKGKFPAPIRMGKRSYWIESEIFAHANNLIAESRKAAA